MKYIKILIIPIALLLILSCGRDEELGPIITVDKAEIGAFPRLVNLITGEYDLANISTSAYSHEVEFQSEDAGANVEAYEVSVSFVDNNPDNGDDSKDAIVYQTYGQSDFGSSVLGLKDITVSYPIIEVAAALGIDVAAVGPGDEFQFTSLVRLSDGRVFADGNTESTIKSSAFRGYFNWTTKATCPIADTAFAGMYTISFPSGGNAYGPAYADGATVEIVPVPGSSTLREFSSPLLPAIGPFTGTTRFDIVCDKAALIEGNTGVGCGGTITFGPASDANGPLFEPLSLEDDSKIVLFVNEGSNPGNCAGQAGDTMSRMELTKM